MRRRRRGNENIGQRVSLIPVWYDDSSIYVDITQPVSSSRATIIAGGYNFEGAEYDIDSGYNDKFYYVDDIDGNPTHYFLITSATITALEVHYPFASNYSTGDMTIYDAVQASITTLLIDSTVLADTTALV